MCIVEITYSLVYFLSRNNIVSSLKEFILLADGKPTRTSDDRS